MNRFLFTPAVLVVVVGALSGTACKNFFGGRGAGILMSHDQPETVDNAPLRIYRVPNITPTPQNPGNLKSWFLTDSEGSAPLSRLRVWAGTGDYGALDLLDDVMLTPTTTIELGLKDVSNTSSYTMTITQGMLSQTSEGLKGPLMVSNNQFDFETENGNSHHLKLKDQQANDTFTLDYIHIRRDAADHTICLHGPLNQQGMCDHKPMGRKAQIKLCSDLTVKNNLCEQASQH